MLKLFFSLISSLKLTVVCLSCALVLVFAGTIAQVHLGLWDAQKQYFQSSFVMWGPAGSSWKIPVWPGGYLLGWVLLVNLIAAHIARFKFTAKKTGIFLTHAGLILLLVGQFLTELFQVETAMRLEEGESKNYSESSRDAELTVVSVNTGDNDEVIAIPVARLAHKGEIRHEKLPFTIRVKEYFPNSDPKLVAPVADPNALRGTHGVGTRLTFAPLSKTAKMDEANFPAAQIEIVTDKGVDSTWMVSNWLSIPGAARMIQRQFGTMLGNLMDKPQEFSVAGRTFQLAMRPTRHYKPYSISLGDFNHDRYKGTDIPKNFSSLVKVRNPSTGPVQEEREVLIYMNKPLRYGGETYYQGSFEPGDTVSILQVVRNPVWLTPYISCIVVALGLIIQFMIHLVGFARKSSGGGTVSKQAPQSKKANVRKGLETVDESAHAAPAMHRAAQRKTT
ncbi:MAG: ResB protein required for cytochrome C biosynthesis [Pedosphaera sp.]|nr:ResB protein required for cytochrome C biosynthesis [Pedosphaera sp.]